MHSQIKGRQSTSLTGSKTRHILCGLMGGLMVLGADLSGEAGMAYAGEQSLEIMDLHESVILYPDKRLRETAKPVKKVDDKIKAIMAEMEAALVSTPANGLAAPQIGHPYRIIMVKAKIRSQPPVFLINPVITERFGQTSTSQEANLSFKYLDYYSKNNPSAFKVVNPVAKIARPEKSRVTYLDRDGAPQSDMFIRAQNTTIQQLVDQLDGVLMIDRLSPDAKAQFFEDYPYYKGKE